MFVYLIIYELDCVIVNNMEKSKQFLIPVSRHKFRTNVLKKVVVDSNNQIS